MTPGDSSRGDRQKGSNAPLKSYGRILEQEMSVASEELRRPFLSLATSGFVAGLTVGTTVLVLLVLGTTLGAEPHPLLERALVGNAYAIGFVLVIFARTDLFTEYTTIAMLPVLVGRATVRALARLWGVIYVTNLLGAVAAAAFLVHLAGGLETADPDVFGRMAGALTAVPVPTMISSGILAGWLMGLLSWLVVAGRETVSQLLFVWIVGWVIGFAGLHHCITGTLEVVAGALSDPGLGAGDAVRFLWWVTLGNTLGSVLFALPVRFVVVGNRESG